MRGLPEDELNTLLHAVCGGRLTRRQVLNRSVALGLSAPVVAGLLAACGGGDDDPDPATPAASAVESNSATPTQPEAAASAAAGATPAASGTAASPGGPTAAESTVESAPAATQVMTTEPATPVATEPPRGGGGLLRLLWWQAPTILNSHLSQGIKDFDASRLILEPLGEFNDDGSVYPVLAEAVPSLEDGTISPDGRSVTWTLKQGVIWHDGTPFTAHDVRFTWEWVVSEGNTATTKGAYANVAAVDVVDDFTVVVHFTKPNPGWFEAFVGTNGRIIPMHIMQDYMGAAGRDAPFNLRPVGTGPYLVSDFHPGTVLLCDINMEYREPGKPYFDSIAMIGGGDATSAARAALQTGETDYAWNLQVDVAALEQMADEGDGVLLAFEGTGVERVLVNQTNPHVEVNGEKSALGNPHPFLSDLTVRRALAAACDREAIATQLYGHTGIPTSNWLVAPAAFVSPNTSYVFDLGMAGALLDEAGWVLEDGRRRKDGAEMSIVFQSSINSVRQRTQEVIKQALAQLGIPVEVVAIESSVFFSSDAGNPSTAAHFYADLQMFANGPLTPYPLSYAEENLSRTPATDIAQRANDWSGKNYLRWINAEYNDAFTAAETEMVPERQAELFIRMNDLVVDDVAVIPLVQRLGVSAHAADLEGISPSRWTSEVYNLADWRRAT